MPVTLVLDDPEALAVRLALRVALDTGYIAERDTYQRVVAVLKRVERVEDGRDDRDALCATLDPAEAEAVQLELVMARTAVRDEQIGRDRWESEKALTDYYVDLDRAHAEAPPLKSDPLNHDPADDGYCDRDPDDLLEIEGGRR